MASSEATTYELRDGAAWITLDSPATRNALSAQLITELLGHLRDAMADDAVRSIVVTGNGKAFCAGADLKGGGTATKAADGTAPTAKQHPLVEILRLMRHGDKPVVCAVNGAAFGGGLGLVAAGDIVLAVEGAKMSFSEVRIGVIPAIISVVVLPKLGEHLGMRLFLTGERFDAAKAVEYGLVHRVVPADGLRAAVEEELALLHLGGPIALREAKRLVRSVPTMSEDEGYLYTANKSMALFRSEEAAEGMTAFAQKRPPRWASPGGED